MIKMHTYHHPIRWTPDSRAVLYCENEGNATNIWRAPINGGPPQQITDFKSDYILFFDRSGDGKSLVCSRATPLDDIVLLSGFR